MLDGGEWLVTRCGQFASGKEPRYSLIMRLGDHQSRSGMSEQGGIPYVCRNTNRDSSVWQKVEFCLELRLVMLYME